MAALRATASDGARPSGLIRRVNAPSVRIIESNGSTVVVEISHNVLLGVGTVLVTSDNAMPIVTITAPNTSTGSLVSTVDPQILISVTAYMTYEISD